MPDPPQKPPMKLYWCMTADSASDGFVAARSPPQAGRYHQSVGGPERANIKVDFVCEIPREGAERIGPPSDNALRVCGAELVPNPDGAGRTVRLAGKVYLQPRWRPTATVRAGLKAPD